jgi:hypothetical protein
VHIWLGAKAAQAENWRQHLQDHIDAYVNAYYDRAEPFVWAKKKVRQRRFKGRHITQL